MPSARSRSVVGQKQENVEVNRKMLSELAASEPYSFKALVDQVAFMRGGGGGSASGSSSLR